MAIGKLSLTSDSDFLWRPSLMEQSDRVGVILEWTYMGVLRAQPRHHVGLRILMIQKKYFLLDFFYIIIFKKFLFYQSIM